MDIFIGVLVEQFAMSGKRVVDIGLHLRPIIGSIPALRSDYRNRKFVRVCDRAFNLRA